MQKRMSAFLGVTLLLLVCVWAAAEPVTVRPGPFAFQLAAGAVQARAFYRISSSAARRMPESKTASPSKDLLTAPWTGVQRQTDAQNQTGMQKMQVAISCACPDYNHVGREWEIKCAVDDLAWVMESAIDGFRLESDQMMELAANQSIRLTTEITENDKYDDYSIAKESYTVSREDLTYGFTRSITIDVVETHGNYKGNVAQWTVIYTFTPMQ
jgi:hypothetical protein